MRGGLDDALDKLARRDELRRRAAGEATGTPPAVQDLIEAIAAVVARNPSLALTVGVEGAGDPVLLHVAIEDGVVQVTADNSVAARAAEAPAATPKHADFDIDLDDEPYAPQSAYTSPAAPAATPPPSRPAGETGEKTRKLSYDDRDRYDPGTGYTTMAYGAPPDPTATPERPDDAYFPPPPTTDRGYDLGRWYDEPVAQSSTPARDATGPTTEHQYAPHPFAATPPPPLPPPTSRRVHAEQHRAPEEPSAAQRSAAQRSAAQHAAPPASAEYRSASPATEYRAASPAADHRASSPAAEYRAAEYRATSAATEYRAASSVAEHRAASDQPGASPGMPTPLPEPVPLRVDSEETELAAKRLAALLRDNPSLLRQTPPD